MSKLVSTRIKELRKQRKLIQSDVAEAIGIGRTGYVRIENGEREADSSTLLKLAAYFDVSVDYLLGRTEPLEGKWSEPLYADKDIKELAELFGKLSQDQQDAIMKITRGMAGNKS